MVRQKKVHIPPPYIEKSFFEKNRILRANQNISLDDFILLPGSLGYGPRTFDIRSQIATNEPPEVQKFPNFTPNDGFLHFLRRVCPR